MRRIMLFLGRLALVLLPLGLGAVILVRAGSDREAPVPQEREEAAAAVRVITMEPIAFAPEVVAFGSVEPADTWRAVAQVSGEVVRLHPDLKPGRLIEKGTEIVRIDAADYELAEAQALARLRGAEAKLAELQARQGNFEASLEIERRALALAEADLERHRTLLERNAASRVAVDQAEDALLQRRARVQEIENTLNLIPAQRRVQEAEKAIAETQLAEARRNVARTRITMPFDGRIAEVFVEDAQFIANGQVMIVAEDMGRAEVSARLRLDQLRMLADKSIRLESLMELSTTELDTVPQDLGLEAELNLDLGDRVATWPAEVRRLSFALDPETRTIGLVVGVDDPFRTAIPGKRPPLVKDLFVEVRLRGAVREKALVLPREAIARGEGGWTVHVVGEENRLRRRAVAIDGMFDNVALVADGLAPGDRVVVGALPVAIEGMRLDPLEDTRLKRQLAATREEMAR